VYDFHSDHMRLHGKYGDSKKASEVENELQVGCAPGDDHFVRMFFAESDADAEKKANSLRQQFRK
jgi:hypothetical protein